jgi:glycosyltransferase involved in cell wall biosynthesis
MKVEASKETCALPESKSLSPTRLDEPFVSIVIPTRNEEKYIGQCLESLARQTYPKEKFEVILFDGRSIDGTLEIVRGFERKINLRIFDNPQVKHVFALNRGIREAKGDYLVFISGHSFVEKNFLEKNVETYFRIKENEPNLAGVGGSLKAVYENTFAMMVSSLFASPFSGASSFWYSEKNHFVKTVAFGFYDKRILENIGFFDVDMIKGQDFEINLRLTRKGYKLFYNSGIKPCYFARNTFSRFLTQTFDNGVAKALCVKKGYFNPIWLIPLLFVFHQLLFIPAYLYLPSSLSIFLLTLFITYWILAILASISVKRKIKQTRFLLLMPFMFWTLHILTGFGFLSGLLIGKKSVRL